jgi:hypothetical protein
MYICTHTLPQLLLIQEYLVFPLWLSILKALLKLFSSLKLLMMPKGMLTSIPDYNIWHLNLCDMWLCIFPVIVPSPCKVGLYESLFFQSFIKWVFISNRVLGKQLLCSICRLIDSLFIENKLTYLKKMHICQILVWHKQACVLIHLINRLLSCFHHYVLSHLK